LAILFNNLAWLCCGNAVNSAKQQVYDLSVYFWSIGDSDWITVDYRLVFTRRVLYRKISHHKKALRFCYG
jgi:hypothetical protein